MISGNVHINDGERVTITYGEIGESTGDAISYCDHDSRCDGGNGRFTSAPVQNVNDVSTTDDRWKVVSGSWYSNNNDKQDTGGGEAGWTGKGGANGYGEGHPDRHGGYGGISGYDPTYFAWISEYSNSSYYSSALVQLVAID